MKGDVGSDGYVMNFTDLKKAMKQICAELDHKVIIPILSDVLVTIQGEINIDVSCEDGSKFVYEIIINYCVLLYIIDFQRVIVYVFQLFILLWKR